MKFQELLRMVEKEMDIPSDPYALKPVDQWPELFNIYALEKQLAKLTDTEVKEFVSGERSKVENIVAEKNVRGLDLFLQCIMEEKAIAFCFTVQQ